MMKKGKVITIYLGDNEARLLELCLENSGINKSIGQYIKTWVLEKLDLPLEKSNEVAGLKLKVYQLEKEVSRLKKEGNFLPDSTLHLELAEQAFNTSGVEIVDSSKILTLGKQVQLVEEVS